MTKDQRKETLPVEQSLVVNDVPPTVTVEPVDAVAEHDSSVLTEMETDLTPDIPVANAAEVPNKKALKRRNKRRRRF